MKKFPFTKKKKSKNQKRKTENRGTALIVVVSFIFIVIIFCAPQKHTTRIIFASIREFFFLLLLLLLLPLYCVCLFSPFSFFNPRVLKRSRLFCMCFFFLYCICCSLILDTRTQSFTVIRRVSVERENGVCGFEHWIENNLEDFLLK